MAVSLELRPEVERDAAARAGAEGIPLPDFLADLIERSLQAERNAAARAVLESFMEGDEQEQQETWNALKTGLDADRLSDRRFF